MSNGARKRHLQIKKGSVGRGFFFRFSCHVLLVTVRSMLCLALPLLTFLHHLDLQSLVPSPGGMVRSEPFAPPNSIAGARVASLSSLPFTLGLVQSRNRCNRLKRSYTRACFRSLDTGIAMYKNKSLYPAQVPFESVLGNCGHSAVDRPPGLRIHIRPLPHQAFSECFNGMHPDPWTMPAGLTGVIDPHSTRHHHCTGDRMEHDK